MEALVHSLNAAVSLMPMGEAAIDNMKALRALLQKHTAVEPSEARAAA